MHSRFIRHIAFGVGIGIGIGIGAILCSAYREKVRQERELRASIDILIAEVKHLKDTLCTVKAASLGLSTNWDAEKEKWQQKRNYDDDDDDEFFDSSQSLNNIYRLDQITLGKKQKELFEKLKEIDILRDETDDSKEESYNILLKLSTEFPLACEVSWRLARAQYDMALLNGKMGDHNKKIIYMKDGIQTGKRSLELDGKNASAHKWYGILIGNFTDFCGNQERIKLGYEFKEHIEEAIHLNPEDPAAHSLLGRWCFEVAMLPWYMRKLAAAIFGEPPTSTIDEALRYAMQAEDLKPDFWKENTLLIGKCYYQKSDYGNAKKWLERAKGLPTKSDDDKLAQKEIEELLLKM